MTAEESRDDRKGVDTTGPSWLPKKPAWRPKKRARLEARSEISILVASALLILVALSSFTLMAYRSSIDLLLGERQQEAEAWARTLRSQFERRGLPNARDSTRLLPVEGWFTLLDASGRPIIAPTPSLLEDSEGLTTVAGYAAFKSEEGVYRIRVDLPALQLRARERSLRILTPVVLVIDIGVILLLMIYVQRLLAPMDLFLDKARRLRGAESSSADEDDVAFLARTFEMALESLAAAEPGESPSDTRALEGALAESLQSGVVLCDRSGAVMMINPLGLEILGLESYEPGTALADVLAPFPRLEAMVGKAVREGATIRREECEIETSAGTRYLGLTAHPLRKSGGSAEGHMVLFADLTEVRRQLADERLSEGLRQIGEVTAGVAHEMRNGLATLKGYLSLIERTDSPDAVRDYAQEIRGETEHLHRVLEDFLAFARPGSARPEEVDLRSLVQRVAADPAFDAAQIEVISRLPPPGHGIVKGDPMLLGRVLFNLLQNAIAAQEGPGESPGATGGTPEAREPRAEVRLELDGEEYAVSVLDRGPGLPPELADRLFEPFVTGRPGGVGLGLALARRIVLLHGGRLEIGNRDAGGVRATFWLGAGKVVTKSSKSGNTEAGEAMVDPA